MADSAGLQRERLKKRDREISGMLQVQSCKRRNGAKSTMMAHNEKGLNVCFSYYYTMTLNIDII